MSAALFVSQIYSSSHLHLIGYTMCVAVEGGNLPSVVGVEKSHFTWCVAVKGGILSSVVRVDKYHFIKVHNVCGCEKW